MIAGMNQSNQIDLTSSADEKVDRNKKIDENAAVKRALENTTTTTKIENPISHPPVPSSRLPRYRMTQPFKILTDIWGVLTSYHFRDELFRYLDTQLPIYLFENYKRPEVYAFVVELVTRTMNDRAEYPDMPMIGLDDCCDDQRSRVDAIVRNIEYRRSHPDKQRLMAGIDVIFNQVWSAGYRTRTLRPHVFDDVMRNFARWHTDPYYIKIYSFASGPVDAQKLFLAASTAGDVSSYLISGFDAHSHYKYDWTKFQAIVTSLGERSPANLFYFTDSPTKGRQAAKAGVTVFIVRREGNRRYRDEDLALFTAIESFDQLDFISLQHCAC